MLPVSSLKASFPMSEVCAPTSLGSLTPMGDAILNRDIKRATSLKEKGALIDEVGIPSFGAIDLFFTDRAYKEDNIEFLRWLIFNGANLHSLQDKTLIQIAFYASYQECSLLMRYSPHIPLSSFLDMALVQLEMEPSAFKSDLKLKISALFLKGATPSSKSYLHFISDSDLIHKFHYELEFDPSASTSVLCEPFCPIELAHTREAAETLSLLGADIDLSPFLKESRAYREALERIEENGFLKAITTLDVKAIIALVASGFDLSWQDKESGWTLLHFLFAIDAPLISLNYQDTAISDRITRIIHILMSHGAPPLLDNMLRTPLMCFSRKQILKIEPLMDLYIHFEATHHSIPFALYKKELLKFLEYDFPKERGSSEDLALKWAVPAFKDFWCNLYRSCP